MRFAICNETFLDWPFDKAFAFAAECGYTGIEIAPFTMATDAREITAARRAEVRRQAEAAGLEVVGLHWLLAKTTGYHLTSPDAAVRRRTAEYVQELARLCRDLGGSKMIFGSPLQRNVLPGVTHGARRRTMPPKWSTRCLPMLEETGVTLCLEPLGPAEGNFLNTAADAVRLIEMIGHPNCRLILDCKAMSSEAVPIPELIRANRKLLAHFHANDPNKQGPGFGELDFVPIFAALGEIDYRGWVSVEVFDYSPGVERLAQESIENMQARAGTESCAAVAADSSVGIARDVSHSRLPAWRTQLAAGLQLGQVLGRADQPVPVVVDVLRRAADLGHDLGDLLGRDHLDRVPGADLQLVGVGLLAAECARRPRSRRTAPGRSRTSSASFACWSYC